MGTIIKGGENVLLLWLVGKRKENMKEIYEQSFRIRFPVFIRFPQICIILATNLKSSS
jgi:hypothetical protein